MSTETSKPRVSVWEWIQTILLSANLVWTTLCLGGFLARTMVVTSVLTAALLAVHAIATWIAPRRPHPAGYWFGPFLVYAAANVAWISPARWLGWIDWFGWLQLVAIFWVVLNGVRSRQAQTALFGVLLAVAAVAVWLGCYQRFVDPKWLMLGRTQADQFLGRSSGPFGIPNSFAALLLLLTPPIGALALRRGATILARVFFGWLLLVFLLGLGLTVSRGAWLGLAIALSVWPIVGARLGWWKRVALAGTVAVAIVLIGLLVYSTSSIVHERFTQLARDAGERSRPILWRAAWAMVRERPILGTGGGSFNVLFDKFRPEGFLPRPVWAHNDYLNTFSDYGVTGFCLFFGPAGVVALMALRRRTEPGERSSVSRRVGSARRTGNWLADSLVRQALGIGILAFALQLFVDFHLKIPALAMALACVTGLLVVHAWPNEPQPSTAAGRNVTATAMFAVAAAIVLCVTPQYRAEALRFAARDAMDRMAKSTPEDAIVRVRLVEIRKQLEQATQIAPSNGQAWSDLSYAVAQTARLAPDDAVKALGREAEAAANRALALSPEVAEFWVRRGIARDTQNLWLAAGTDFAQAVVLSPNAVLPWYHYAYHMLLRPTGLDMGQAAVEFCLRLDPSNPDAQALRQRLATSRSSL
jgi:hypothetical protein